MPLTDPQRVEYPIITGQVAIVSESGDVVPAYWAHPDSGGVYPAVALLHDWWGLTASERHMVNILAQNGYYAIAPDLFVGKQASTPQQALALVQNMGDTAYPIIDEVLRVLETHSRTNRNVAAVGVGMGGSLALEAALKRADIEAAVSFYGFPQKHLGKFTTLKCPVLAIFGGDDRFVDAKVIQRFKDELSQSEYARQSLIETLQGVGRGFFEVNHMRVSDTAATTSWKAMLGFLRLHLERGTPLS
jgi:carboxymethylenebutenolidase